MEMFYVIEIKYVIQIKTGPGILAGTSNSIYVILHGEKYSTELLHVPGWYNMNGLDEQSISSIDVTPVSQNNETISNNLK